MQVRIATVTLVCSMFVTALAIVPVGAQSINVLIDGSPVAFDQPPVSVGGRVLVPLRGVFERLGATVKWDAGTGTATAVRGSTQVLLTVGLRQATVDGRQIVLDVPAMIVGGRTMVPLRFVSEAMGARVDWDNTSRTVAITSSQGQPAPPAQPAPPRPAPDPAPTAAPSGSATIEGTVLRVDAQASPPRILVDRDGRINTFAVSADTTIALVEIGSGRSTTIALDQIRVGALARVTAEGGRAILIRVSVREVTGRIDAVTGRQIALANGQTYTFIDDVHVQVNGRDAGRDQLRAGMDVTLRLNPQSSAVLEVAARAAAQPAPPAPSATAAPPAGTLRIASFTHNAQKALRVGENLSATLQGTAGGAATFEIFGVATGIAMRETSPGTYQGTYTVKAGDTATNAAVFGRLRRDSQDAPLVQAGTPVTIDTAVPTIVQRYPEAGSTIPNVRPNILITYNDGGGSGINPAATQLFVNGRDVTAASTVTETGVAYNPPAALAEAVTIRLVLVDRAGNTTDDRFSFRIVVQQGSLIRSVTVSPTTPLRPGQVLTITVVGEPGGQASFAIEGVADSISMTESQAQPGTYTGTFTVRPSDAARDARISVQLTRAGTTSRSDASARLTVVADVVVAPTITAPAAGTTIRAPIAIRGRATPGHSIVVRVDYRGTIALFQVQGTLRQLTTQTDAQGNWSVTLSQDAPVRGVDITISATAVDQANRRSQPTTVVVKQGG